MLSLPEFLKYASLIVEAFLHFFICILNPFDVLGEDYGSLNFWERQLILPLVNLDQNLVFGPIIINALRAKLRIQIGLSGVAIILQDIVGNLSLQTNELQWESKQSNEGEGLDIEKYIWLVQYIPGVVVDIRNLRCVVNDDVVVTVKHFHTTVKFSSKTAVVGWGHISVGVVVDDTDCSICELSNANVSLTLAANKIALSTEIDSVSFIFSHKSSQILATFLHDIGSKLFMDGDRYQKHCAKRYEDLLEKLAAIDADPLSASQTTRNSHPQGERVQKSLLIDTKSAVKAINFIVPLGAGRTETLQLLGLQCSASRERSEAVNRMAVEVSISSNHRVLSEFSVPAQWRALRTALSTPHFTPNQDNPWLLVQFSTQLEKPIHFSAELERSLPSSLHEHAQAAKAYDLSEIGVFMQSCELVVSAEALGCMGAYVTPLLSPIAAMGALGALKKTVSPVATTNRKRLQVWSRIQAAVEELCIKIVHGEESAVVLQVRQLTASTVYSNFKIAVASASVATHCNGTVQLPFLATQNIAISLPVMTEIEQLPHILHATVPLTADLFNMLVEERWEQMHLRVLEDGLRTIVSVDAVDVKVSQNDSAILGGIVGSITHGLQPAVPVSNIPSIYRLLSLSKDASLQLGTMDIMVNALSVQCSHVDESNNREIRYCILDRHQLLLHTESCAPYYSHQEIYLTSHNSSKLLDITRHEVDRSTSHVTKSCHVLIIFNQQEDSCRSHTDDQNLGSISNGFLIHQSKRFVKLLHMQPWQEQGVCRGICFTGSYSETTLPKVALSVEFEELVDLLRVVKEYTVGSCEAKETMKQLLSLDSMYDAAQLQEVENTTKPGNIPPEPSSISRYLVGELQINMGHLLQPCMTVSAKPMEIAMLKFGPTISQTAVKMTSLHLFEHTVTYAVHTCLVGNIRDNHLDGIPPNTLELHVTNEWGQCSLMEMKAVHLRVAYIHRPVMTIINYLRDHLIESICNILRNENAPPTPPAVNTRRGMFRLGAVVLNSEVHLPNNSSGTDALTVVFNELKLFKLCPLMQQQDPKYGQGPLIGGGKWLGEMSNCNLVLDRLFRPHRLESMDMNVGSTDTMGEIVTQLSSMSFSAEIHDCRWQLPSANLAAPRKVTLCGASKMVLDISLFNATICSWCNSNAVGEGMSLTCTFTIYPVTEIPAGEPAEDPPITRNTMIVDVTAQEVDWIMAQGQYFAIVNLIQQNFSELQEWVSDPFILPTPKTVPLGETVYGKYSINPLLPTISTVPIHIHKGKIVAVNNLPEYYELFSLPLCDPLPRQYPDMSKFVDTIPLHSYHNLYRKKVFAQKVGLGSPGGISPLSRLSRGELRRKGREEHRKSRIPPPTFSSLDPADSDGEDDVGDSILTIYFTGLELDFYRKHFGGGNGIEVSANHFVIVGTSHGDDEDNSTNLSLDLQDVAVENIILAPKSLSLLNSDKKHRAKDLFRVKNGDAPVVPHIRYSQQGVGNLRRCIVQIEESVAVANLSKILSGVTFFMKPIHVISERNLKLIQRLNRGPYDFKTALDVEVHVRNTVISLPNINPLEGASSMCLHVNLDYNHAWRGFLLTGPGKISYSIDVDLMSLYLAPMHEIYSSEIHSLVEPCKLEFITEFMCMAVEDAMVANYRLLAPWINFEPWVHKVNKLAHPSAVRFMTFKIYPANSNDSSNGSPVSPTPMAAESEPTSPKQLTETEDSTKVPPARTERSGDSDDEEGGESVGEREAEMEKEEKEPSTPADSAAEPALIKFHLSLKDIQFMIVAIQQLRENLSKRQIAKTGEEDPYYPIIHMERDFDHLPPLMHFLVYTDLDIHKPWKIDIKEVLTEIANVEVTLRNNTYNLNIVKLNLYEMCLIYNRSTERLHIASGLSFAGYAFNDVIDDWEPLIEPIDVRMIGATDSTAGAVESGLTASRIKLEVDAGPLEINAAQSMLANVLRKLTLADVVTTSSVHLPPYKVINELGVPVHFTIGMGGGVITRNSIANNSVLPIEVHQLTEALNSYKERRKYNTINKQEFNALHAHSKEYLMGISFQNFRDHYMSKLPVTIDKQGIFPFEMVLDQSNSNAAAAAANAGNKPTSIQAVTSLDNLVSVVVEQSQRSEPSVDGGSVAASISTSATPVITSAKFPSGVKYAQEVPLAILDMKVKHDGIRELLLRSMLSIKNTTSRVFQISIRLFGSSSEASICPGKEWHVPVRFANPKSAMFFRLDERSDWIEGLPSFQYLITQGYWGSPSKLRAELCVCPPESTASDVADGNWIVLIKPEVKDGKAMEQQALHNQSNSVSVFVPIKYPSKEMHRNARLFPEKGTEVSVDGSVSYADDIYNMGLSGTSVRIRYDRLQPMCIHLLSPLQLCNLLCQPLLYRIADVTGFISSEGLLIPGEIIDIHSLGKLYSSKIFISIRMLNYCWSKWAVIFTRNNPYSSSEKTTEITMNSLEFLYQNRELTLPALDVTMSLREHLVKFTCPVLVSNRTGMQLEFCESSSPDNYVPQSSRSSIETFIPLHNGEKNPNLPAASAVKPLLQHRNSTKLKLKQIQQIGNSDDSEEDEEDSPVREKDRGYESDTEADRKKQREEDGRDGDELFPKMKRLTRKDLQRQQSTAHVSSASKRVQSTHRTRAGKIVTLVIHLPFDHLRRLEVVASGEWTLLDVFLQIKEKLSVSALHQSENHYLFFLWENGKYGSNKVELIDIVEDVVEAAEAGETDMSPPDGGGELKKASTIPNKPALVRRQPSNASEAGEIPPNMAFSMLADCAGDPLTMETKVETLKGTRLRLCHESEFSIYEQVRSIKTEVVAKESIFKSMNLFSRAKHTHHAIYMKPDGDLPFRPHKMLGFTPSLSVRVPYETDWSEAIDVFRSDFDASDLTLALGTSVGKTPSPMHKQASYSYYEFGTYVERGKGFFQNITTVTIVPKHVIVSKLPIPIEIRQLNVTDNYNPICLVPGSVQSYHFPVKGRIMLLQIRRYQPRSQNYYSIDSTNSNLPAPRKSLSEAPSSSNLSGIEEEPWVGEVDICNLGVVYAKLRNPLYIVKIQVEIIGASVVATFSQQSMKWPPYRIDNMTSYDVRFKQSLSAELISALSSISTTVTPAPVGAAARPTSKVSSLRTKALAVLATTKKGEAAPATASTGIATSYDLVPEESTTPIADTSAHSTSSSGPPTGANVSTKETTVTNTVFSLPWDYVNHLESCSYGWDFPISGSQMITMEFGKPLSAGGAKDQQWVMKEINFDDDSKIESVQFRKSLPSLGNPLAEGYLMHYSSLTETWQREYCILKPDVLYIYQDDSRSRLTDIINFTCYTSPFQHEAKQQPDTANAPVQRRDSLDSVEYVPHHSCVMRYQEKGWDIMNTIQSSMTYFGAVIGGNTSKSRFNFDSNKVRILILKIADFLGMLADVAKNMAMRESDASERASEGRMSVERGEFRDRLLSTESAVSRLVSGQLEGSPGAIDSGSAKGSELPTPSVRETTASPAVGVTSLKDLLASGTSVEQLLDEASNASVRVSDVISALLGIGEVDNLEKASELCGWLISEEFLVARNQRKAVDSSNPMGLPYCDSEEDKIGLEDAADDGEQHDEPIPSRETFAMSSRTSFMVTGPVDESKKDNRSDKASSLSRSTKKKRDVLSEFESVDLYINPPTLNPELAAKLDETDGGYDNDAVNTHRKSIVSGKPPNLEDESQGFTLLTENNTTKHHFKCSSEMEFFGWIQACRQSIELSWIEHELGKRSIHTQVTMDDFQQTLNLKLRADGPTKVLEITEQEEGTSGTKGPRRKGRRGSKQLLPFAMKVDKLKSLKKSLVHSQIPEGTKDEGQDADDNGPDQVLSVMFAVKSVAISFIDSEPAEMIYFSLRDIEMSVERSIDTVKFSGTVNHIQFSNQLLAPEFPVTLFPRRIRDKLAEEKKDRRLMLPGLNPNRTNFPSLHLYMQQKYYQTISEVSATSSTAIQEQETKLQYFDIFILWIAPMQLDVDEEIIVRVIRYAQNLKSAIQAPLSGAGGSSLLITTSVMDDTAYYSLQNAPSKSLGSIDPKAVFDLHGDLLSASKRPYLAYGSRKNAIAVYFGLLQLHPLDICMTFRPSPQTVTTNAETAIISIVSQLDGARLCLNAFIAEHAFGSPAIIGEILVKHYRASFWRQFHKLVGSSDIVEGSVGLVANLGTGVYDLFYEPIDGLLDENGSFLTGLSKGGKSLASRAIGGTSGFASQITGGVGKGVSFLTLDTEFQRNRAYRRFNKTTTVSEGLYVGTKELGKNIVEGVSGIVVSPYRGWETGGAAGFAGGVAKGILGVALKPAVGVFDLASRAAEGLRNTAMTGNMEWFDDRDGIHRMRIPRAFGRNGSVLLYDAEKAAAQYVADSLTGFKKHPRMHVVHFQHMIRKVAQTPVYVALYLHNVGHTTYKTENNSAITDEIEQTSQEAWGLCKDNSYILFITADRLVLAQLCTATPEPATGRTQSVSRRKQSKTVRKFIWSCPAVCIDHFYHDARGDLALALNNCVHITGQWNGATPTALDVNLQNYFIFQSLLEQTIGVRLARQQLYAPANGLIQSGILKRYSSGIRGFLMSPTKHTYRLFGNVLFEFTANSAGVKKEKAAKEKGEEGATSGEAAASNAAAAERAEMTSHSEAYIDNLISQLFAHTPPVTMQSAEPMLADTYLSFVYPLVDLYVVGPNSEEGGKLFSITMSRIDSQKPKMRVLRKDEDAEHLSEYMKISLSLIFSSYESAALWRRNIEQHIVFRPDDVLPHSPMTAEEKKKNVPRSLIPIGRSAAVDENVVAPEKNSVLGTLVIPTSGCNQQQTEDMKIQVVKTLTAVKQMNS